MLQHFYRLGELLDPLHQRRDLDLDAEHLVAEGIHAELGGDGERLLVVLQGVLGLGVGVGVVDSAPELDGDGLGVGRKGAEDEGVVDVVCVD